MIDENTDETTPGNHTHLSLIGAAMEDKPASMKKYMDEIMANKISEVLAAKRAEIALNALGAMNPGIGEEGDNEESETDVEDFTNTEPGDDEEYVNDYFDNVDDDHENDRAE